MATMSPELRQDQDQFDPYADILPALTEEINQAIAQPRPLDRTVSGLLGRNITLEDVSQLPIDASDIGEAAALVLWHYRSKNPETFDLDVAILPSDDPKGLERKAIFEEKMDTAKHLVIDGYWASRRDSELLARVLLAVLDPDEVQGTEVLNQLRNSESMRESRERAQEFFDNNPILSGLEEAAAYKRR